MKNSNVGHVSTDTGYDHFADSARSLTPEQISINNHLELERVRCEHKNFVTAFEHDGCYLCGNSISSFSSQKPCVHWLLKPNGFKKKHFSLIYALFDCFQILAYLRWVANYGYPFRDINNLVDEHSGKKKIDLTIHFKNLKWSFSCSDSDSIGHPGASSGNIPHYHFQMRIQDRPFIKYNDFHVPLSREDQLKLHIMSHKGGLLRHCFSFGEGMQELLNEIEPNALIANAIPANVEDAALHIQTIVMANEGQPIKGEEIGALLREASERGVSVASLVHKLGGKRITLIEPGAGVPMSAERKGGRGNKPNEGSIQ